MQVMWQPKYPFFIEILFSVALGNMKASKSRKKSMINQQWFEQTWAELGQAQSIFESGIELDLNF